MVVACLFNSRRPSRMNSCHPASNTKGHLVPSCVIVFFSICLSKVWHKLDSNKGNLETVVEIAPWGICSPLQAALESRQWTN